MLLPYPTLHYFMSLEQLAKQQPSVVNALYKYKHEVFKDGALTIREKEIIAVAVSTLLKCDACLEVHAQDAMKQGASNEQLREAMVVAMYLAGPSVMIWSPILDKVMQGSLEVKEKA
jgi:AhpD family alkylhydroperoxidase